MNFLKLAWENEKAEQKEKKTKGKLCRLSWDADDVS